MLVSNALLGLAWTIVAYFIYSFISSLLLSRQNAAKALALGCEEPPHQKNRYPLGIEHIIRALKADRAKLFPVDCIKRINELGCTTYRYSLLGATNIVTVDEKNIQAVLATQFDDFDLGPGRSGNFWPLLGSGIFTQDGKMWEHSRAMMRPQFARDQVSDLDLEEKHVRNMMMALDLRMKGKSIESVDLMKLFFRLTLDSATEFLFGSSVGSQIGMMENSKGSSKQHNYASFDFAKAFDQGLAGLGIRLRFIDMYWLVWPKGFSKACKTCHEFIDGIVQNTLSKRKTERGANDRYVFLEALAEQTQDPVELRSQLLNILLAGRDTTASLLSWTFLCLSRDPACYKKLRETILHEFGTYENPSPITFEKLKACQYLQFCNNEALRLYPVVPINVRYANKDTTLPRGGGKDRKSKVFVQKGSSVEYCVHVLHHRKDIWGEDAEEFRPERWEGRKFGWEYLPFNGGPRICLGQQFALTEASYVITRLLQRFESMEYLGSQSIIRHNLCLTNAPGDPVDIRMQAA
ncbi:cytochrome P450 alkane hydroxylase-like protein [Tricladium varicosporioides]|nr:cytochrome P450 alkane hydroxylase-like protein [Hymenoscyphus varicosporioides]